MGSSSTAAWLCELTAPLMARFGGDLTLTRCADAVCWGFGGQSVVIEQAPDETLSATFLDVARIDAVTGQSAVAAYRTGSVYRLTEAGCARFVADLVDFFSGVREPHFIFADALSRSG